MSNAKTSSDYKEFCIEILGQPDFSSLGSTAIAEIVRLLSKRQEKKMNYYGDQF